MIARPALPHRQPFKRALWVAVACVMAMFPLYWWAFERNPNLPDALYGGCLAVAGIAALLGSWRLRLGFWLSTVAPAFAIAATVMLRVVWDVAKDATSHNLWPFEVAIALGVGVPVAAVGAGVGWLLSRYAAGRD